MRGKRIAAAALALWLLFVGGKASANGEERQIGGTNEKRRISSALGCKQAGETAYRSWWGVLYEDALLLARMDEAENEEEAENGTEQTPETVEFVWPFWDWLLSLFGFSGTK